ncbi:MAG: ATP-binding protein [Solirubrobacteraceae bacterium]
MLFCDLVGSTDLSRRVDAEDLRIAMKAYHHQARLSIERFGGFIGRLLGDGVLAYFGWPQSQEDQATQAVRAGLDMVTSIKALRFADATVPQCRVGIATGRVVIGDETDPDLAFGETLNLAARLQTLAEPGQVVIDEPTNRWIGKRFQTISLAPVALKGFATPVTSWSVLEERLSVDRFDARALERATFADRQSEMDSLCTLWESASSGNGCAVIVRGGPGIGKSRLVREFTTRAALDQVTVLRFQCSAHHVSTGFYPVIQSLEAETRTTAGEASATAMRQRLERLFSDSTDPCAADLTSLEQMLDLLPADRARPTAPPTPERRAQAISLLAQATLRRAAERPMLIVIEDVHWIDPSTRELLETAIAQLPEARAMVIATTRETHGSLATQAAGTEIMLGAVADEDTEFIVRSIPGSSRISDREISFIVSRADGIPMFAEELTSAAIEHGHVSRFDDLPDTVEASVTARLDFLRYGKEVAQIGSVLGREFSTTALHAVAGTSMPRSRLQAGLRELTAAGLAVAAGSVGQPRYRFSHAMVQEVAYASLVRHKRQQLHRRAAHNALSATVKSRQPELVAHHLTEAGLVAEALTYWKSAGIRSAEKSANAEAISHFRRGLDLIETLPQDPARDAIAFSFLVGLSGPLIAEHGYTSVELEECIAQAMVLSNRTGHTPEIYSLLYARWAFLLTSGAIEESLQVARDFSGLAERQCHADAGFACHRMLGASYMCMGELELAARELDQIVEGYDRRKHARLAHSYGVDLLVAALCFASEVAWLSGAIEQARFSAAKALAEAHAADHVNSIGMALHFCGLIAFLSRDPDGVRAYADQMRDLTARQPAGAWPLLTGAMVGWSLVVRGQMHEGMRMMMAGVDRTAAAGVSMFLPIFHCRIAEILIDTGQFAEAAQRLSAAEALTGPGGEGNYRGELLRLRGVLRMSEDGPSSGDGDLRQAIEVAREQGARSIELRAATTYAAVLVDRGDAAQGVAVLAPIVEVLQREGNHPDLAAARAVLAQAHAGRG